MVKKRVLQRLKSELLIVTFLSLFCPISLKTRNILGAAWSFLHVS